MEKKKTVPAALAVMTFLLAAVLAAAAAVHLRQSAGETETGGKTAYFENILLSGQSTVHQVSRTEEASARDAAFPSAPVQQICLHRRCPGKWTAYVPADLSGGFYLHFTGFASLRLSAVPDREGAVPADMGGVLTVKSGTYLSVEELRSLTGDPGNGDPEKKAAGAGAAGAGEEPEIQDPADPAKDSGLPGKVRLQVAAVSRDGGILEEAELTFFFANAVPTLYLDTVSGSMEAVNADKTHRENGSFLFFREDGRRDVSGTCSLHGRGNSSWNEDKKQYSLNLTDSAEVLGMDASKKFALIANSSDDSNLRNRTAFDIARLCAMPASPGSAFVNVYLNGVYNGLYLLAQRPNAKGGSVRIAKLEKANEAAARQDPEGTGVFAESDPEEIVPFTESDPEGTGAFAESDPEGTVTDSDGLTAATDLDGLTAFTDSDGLTVVTDPDGLETHAFGRQVVPADITGGYLLEMDGRYEDEDCWFSTQRHHFVIKYPEKIPLQEAEYIAGYVREAEKAIYAEDGKNPDTGRPWEEYLDADSWAKMYLLQDFMAQWDVESFSFFIYKDAGDPLLYCGPVWDFDLSMGTTGLGRLPNLMQRSSWLLDHRPGWLTQLYAHADFSSTFHAILEDTFVPVLETYLGAGQTGEADSMVGYAAWMDRLHSSAAMDAYRWEEKNGFPEDAQAVRAWLLGRLDFYTEYEAFPERFCTVTFRYGFADMDVYIRRGSRIGFVPTEEFGEHLYKSFRKKYGEVDGWTAEDGTVLTEDTVIDSDQVFLPF